MLETQMLYLLVRNSIYINKYSKILDKQDLSEELKRLYNTIKKYYYKYNTHTYISKEELTTYFNMEYPVLKNKELYYNIISTIYNHDISETLASDIMRKLAGKAAADRIITHLLPVMDGEQVERVSEIGGILEEYRQMVVEQDTEQSPFVEDDIAQLFASEINVPGLRWRLQCLNDSIGPLRGGTLGHIFARPETGKTSFLASELTHFASQLSQDEYLLGIYNEDKGRRIKTRLYESALGMSEADIGEQIHRGFAGRIEERFNGLGGQAIKLRYNPGATIEEIQSYLDTYRVRVLVIDIADHIKFRDQPEKKVEFLEELYRRFRIIAGTYNIDVITVGQADAASAGKKTLFLENMNNSKVGKQGALDYAIGIGASYDPAEQDLRWLSICKNKLNSEGGSGPYCVRIDKSTGRYYDL